MNDVPAAVSETDEAQSGIPLDLAPLLAPYGQYRRLTVRIVHLPTMACFSQGAKNDDGSWSLTPDELDGLELLLPQDAEPPIALAVRIVGIDRDENATIVGQFDVPLMMIRRDGSAATGDAESRAAEAVEKLAALEGELDAALARATAAEMKVTDLDEALQREAEAAAAHLAEQLENQAATLKAELSQESEAHVAEAVAQAVKDTEARFAAAAPPASEDIEARIAEAVEQAVAQAEAHTGHRLRAEFARQLDEARREIEMLEHKCAGSDATLQHLESKLADAEAQAQAEIARRLSEQAAQLDEEAQRELLAARSAQMDAEAKATEAVRKASALESALASAEDRIAAADAAKASLEDDLQRQARDAQRRLTEELATQASAAQARWRAECESRVAEAVRVELQKAEAKARTRLAEARAELQSEAAAALTAAEAKWRAEETRRFATARAEWQRETQAEAKRGRRKLRFLARKQALVNAGGRLKRLMLVGGAIAAAYYLYVEFRPSLVDTWIPKGLAVYGDLESAALAELDSLTGPAKVEISVAASLANVRSGPSTDAEIRTRFSRGTVITVLERRGEWLLVEARGNVSQRGWLHRSLLEGL